MKDKLNLKQIKEASIVLSQTSDKERDNFLHSLAIILEKYEEDIVTANKKDIEQARENGITAAFIERLILDKQAIKKLILRLEKIQNLKRYDGVILEQKILGNGIQLKKVAVPLGVILVIYESRPEVTVDVAALCIKSGNAVVLKGGSEALNTNQVLYECIQESLRRTNLSERSVSLVINRETTTKLLKENNYIDLVIARGGYELVKKVLDQSRIPVLAHSAGGARIYIDKSADLELAEKIIINAKTSKPSACNSLDTILIHQDIASKFIPLITTKLKSCSVEVVENNWDKEFLSLVVNIKVAKDVSDAIKFISNYTKRHSEGIIASDKKIIETFVNGIDTAAVFINCSTRFHDGFEFGMGAEMGISTGKLHARGPVGLTELTTYKWEVYGNGQIRE